MNWLGPAWSPEGTLVLGSEKADSSQGVPAPDILGSCRESWRGRPQKGQGQGSSEGFGSRCSRQAGGPPLGKAAPALPSSRTRRPRAKRARLATPVSRARLWSAEMEASSCREAVRCGGWSPSAGVGAEGRRSPIFTCLVRERGWSSLRTGDAGKVFLHVVRSECT